MPKLESDERHELPDYRSPVQREHRAEAIHPGTKVILREPMCWCAVIDGYIGGQARADCVQTMQTMQTFQTRQDHRK